MESLQADRKAEKKLIEAARKDEKDFDREMTSKKKRNCSNRTDIC